MKFYSESRWKERKNSLKTNLGFFRNRSWEGINVAFIVSTGRTGTQFLTKFFRNLSEKIDARHEPNPDFLKLGVNFARGKISFQKTVNAIRKGRLWICDEVNRNNKKIYLEANNRYFSLIPQIWQVFPQAKIIHVIRDGRDYVRSVMNRDHYTFKDKIYYKKNLRLQAVDFPKDSYCKRWSSMDQFEKCCWQWVKKDNFISESIKEDSRAITVKFEDIFNREGGYPGIYEIINFLGLEVPDEKIQKISENFMEKKININKSENFPRWKMWDDSLRKKFLNIAGPYMKKYNYDLTNFIPR